MGYSLVQSVSGNGIGTSCIVNPTSTVGGDLLVLAVISGLTPTTVSDNQGNTWTLRVSQGSMYFYDCTDAIGEVTAVTIGFAGSAVSTAYFREYSGITTAIDQSASASGTSTTPNSGASSPTTSANELVLGVFGGITTLGQVITAGSGFGNLSSAGGAGGVLAFEDKASVSIGPQTATFSLGASQGWVAAVATYPTVSLTISVSETVPFQDAKSLDIEELAFDVLSLQSTREFGIVRVQNTGITDIRPTDTSLPGMEFVNLSEVADPGAGKSAVEIVVIADARQYGFGVLEQVGVSDTHKETFGGVVDDLLSISDSASANDESQFVSESLAITDSEILGRVGKEPFTIIDQKLIGNLLSRTDFVRLNDAQIILDEIVRVDPVLLFDTRLISFMASEVALLIDDAAVYLAQWIVSDALIFSDLRSINFGKRSSEMLGVADRLTREIEKMFSETMVLMGVAYLTHLVLETLVFVDTVRRLNALNKTESISLLDSVVSHGIVRSDTLHISDLANRISELVRSDLLMLSDLHRLGYSEKYLETLSLSDLESKTAQEFVGDRFVLSDLKSLVSEVFKTEHLGLVDAFMRIPDRTVSESISLSDAVRRLEKLIRSDVLAVQDARKILDALSKSDGLSFIDREMLSVHLPVLEGLGLTDREFAVILGMFLSRTRGALRAGSRTVGN